MNLFAGPYTHEFGHELFSFQGYIRKISKDYDKVVVCSKECMRYLYRDFVDEFIPLGNLDNRPQLGDTYKKVTMEECMNSVARGSGIFKHDQEFVKYGTSHRGGLARAGPDEIYDIVFHARDLPWGMCKNLDKGTYERIFKELSGKYRIAFMGTKSGAHCPDGAADIRDIHLRDLSDILHSCKLVVGQSSGPIHFSSLCGADHLTWGGQRFRTFSRYAKHWNPFSSRCFIFEQKGLDYIHNRLRRMRVGMDILEKPHVNLIQIDNFRSPTFDELTNSIDIILNSSQRELNE